MFNRNKLASFIIGVEMVGLAAGAIYCYGQYKYYEGRVSKNKELLPILEIFRDQLINKKEEA